MCAVPPKSCGSGPVPAVADPPIPSHLPTYTTPERETETMQRSDTHPLTYGPRGTGSAYVVDPEEVRAECRAWRKRLAHRADRRVARAAILAELAEMAGGRS